MSARKHAMDDEQKFRRYQLVKTARWLLRHTIRDLKQRSTSTDEYELLGIAGVLRRTLIDQHIIADLGRAKGTPAPVFSFASSRVRVHDEPAFVTSVWLPDPGDFRVPAETANMKGLLAATVGSVNGVAVSVRDIILHFANVEGGVHVGHPKSPASEALRDIFNFRSDGWRTGLMLLADIAAVVAEGLSAMVAYRDPKSAANEARGIYSGDSS